MSVAVDQPVPAFQAQATSNTQVSLDALKGKQVVLYFYPKDNTPGCTTQGQGFRDQHGAFSRQHGRFRRVAGQPENP
jgi:thioredoxin-dependent peroxiredoxin